MINNRILHLIKDPEDIRALDVENIRKVIGEYPYVQPFRALYLIALNKFGSKEYQSVLALTASYTTDKKILYQLLNPTHNKNIVNAEIKENNFLNDDNDEIIYQNEIVDVDSDVAYENLTFENNESLQIGENISQKMSNMDDNNDNSVIVEEKNIETEKSEPSFVINPKASIFDKIQSIEKENQTLESENISLNTDIELNINSSYVETQENTTMLDEELADWKPMNIYISPSYDSFEDSVISKTEFDKETEKEEQIIKKNKVEAKFPIKVTPENAENPKSDNSNVPLFINTWTNWLHKQKPQNYVDTQVEKKEAIINKFIENNPKIGSVKENTDFVLKDKGENISHLMTETLAVLYLEQRIYAKAIEAFKILQEKYPEKSKDFKKKIKYIKDLQSGKIQPKDS